MLLGQENARSRTDDLRSISPVLDRSDGLQYRHPNRKVNSIVLKPPRTRARIAQKSHRPPSDSSTSLHRQVPPSGEIRRAGNGEPSARKVSSGVGLPGGVGI